MLCHKLVGTIFHGNKKNQDKHPLKYYFNNLLCQNLYHLYYHFNITDSYSDPSLNDDKKIILWIIDINGAKILWEDIMNKLY
jgi:hypothetical protein